MATTIKLKSGTGAPSAGDLVVAEPALDLTNKRLYTEDSGGTVIEVGTNPTSVTTGAITATGIDVTGTVTADGLTSDGGISIDESGTAINITNGDGLTQLGKLHGEATDGFVIEGKVNNNLTLRTKANTAGEGIKFQDSAGDNMMFIDGTTGDISFYEDTGTTAKLFWDASAESLGIGTSSPQEELHIEANYPQLRIASNLNVLGSNNLVATVDGYATNGLAWRIGRVFGSADMEISNERSSAMTFATGSTERMRIDSSGNLLVGKTANDNSTVGGSIRAGESSFVSGDSRALTIVRTTNDGSLAEFRKAGTTVGSIRTISGDSIGIGTGDAGLRFVSSTNRIQPVDMDNGLNSDALTSLGDTNKRFKDLYLSGGVYLGGTGSANKLDDYEEGTWTPTSYSGWATNPTSVSGSYVKIGEMVTLYVDIFGGVFNHQAYLVGIPFAATKEGTAAVINGSIDNVADAFVASSNRIWFRATNGTSSDRARFSLTYRAS